MFIVWLLNVVLEDMSLIFLYVLVWYGDICLRVFWCVVSLLVPSICFFLYIKYNVIL